MSAIPAVIFETPTVPPCPYRAGHIGGYGESAILKTGEFGDLK